MSGIPRNGVVKEASKEIRDERIAIRFDIPFLAIARFALKSPKELPHAKTVMPSTVEWTLLTIPMNSRQFTRRPAMTSMYVAATKTESFR